MGALSSFASDFSSFKTEFSSFETFFSSFEGDFSSLETDFSSFLSDLSSFVTQFSSSRALKDWLFPAPLDYGTVHQIDNDVIIEPTMEKRAIAGRKASLGANIFIH